MIFNWGENGGEAKQHVFVFYFTVAHELHLYQRFFALGF